MTKRSLSAIAFDFDGTLINSGPDLAAAINLMLQAIGRATFSTEHVLGWIGNGVELLVKRALSGREVVDPNLDERLYREARAHFDQFYSDNLCVNTYIYPGVIDALAKLHDNNIPMAVITNKPYEYTIRLLDALKLDRYFDIVLGGDSLAQRKPDPAPLHYILDKRDIDATQMVMVGDSRNDILAAKAAGCPSFAVTYGYNYGEPIEQTQPDWSANNLFPLVELFRHQ